MKPPNLCPTCGKPLPVDAPMGVCPRCLIAFTEATDGDSTNPQAFDPPAPEDLANNFPQLEIIELIGRGGMGAVYKVRQKELDRVVALKILPPSISTDPTFAERFTSEARTLAKLNHPNIVTLYESGCADGLYYFLMEFIDGVNLRQAMSAGQFTPEQALAIVPPVCEALQLAHSQGIIHRDIKPENLLLDKDGRIKIADFGVAKLIGGRVTSSTSKLDGSSVKKEAAYSLPVGTPRYMAPEQTEDPTHADHRVDIYALGSVLYELLTGETPKDKILLPSKLLQVDVRIDEIVLRALNKKPELRFSTAAEFRSQVETFTSETSTAASTEHWKLPAAGNTLHSSLFTVLALIFAGLSGLLGASTFFMMPDPPSVLIWSIPASAMLGFALAFPLRQTKLGKRALFGAGVNFIIWVTVAVVSTPHTRSDFRYKLPQSSLTAKRLVFEPTRGMEGETHWSVSDKPSDLNPDGWAVYARMTLGGKAKIKFPGEANRRCEITLVEGDDESITLRIDDLIRKHTMTLSLIRDRPGEVSIDGVGYRLVYLTIHTKPSDQDQRTKSFAHVIMTPAGQPKTNSEQSKGKGG